MRFRRFRDEEPEVNLIPLIDIMLVVLIFLAVTTTYSKLAELRIDLPSATAKPVAERKDDIVVSVTSDGRYAIERKMLSGTDVEAIANALRQTAQNRADTLIVIHADAQAPHQAVVNVMEAARIAQLSRIAFVTERNDSNTK
jgi:biopolymer transport protein ExbD